MAHLLKQSTSITIRTGPFLDEDDGKTTEEALTVSQADIRLSKNGGAYAQTNGAGGATHDENGWYSLTLDATDTNTLGRLLVAIHESGALPVWREFMIVSANTWDSFVSTENLDVNVVEISDDTTSATNLELQYDTTGLTGDTFPATQRQLDAIALTGAAINTAAESYVLTTGTQSANTVASVVALDGTNHEHTDTAGAMDLYYQFDVAGDGVPTAVTVTGYLNGNNDDLEVYAFNWGGSSWDQIGTLEGKAAATNDVNMYTLFTSHVGTGANLGKVRIRFTDGAFTLTTATLAVDQIYVSYAVVARSVGYADGAIWVDTNASNTNTESFVDGVADNPVSTWAAALTLSTNLNITRFRIVNGSSITLTGNSDNYTIIGQSWSLALGGQSIAGIHVIGADITGVGTGATEPNFTDCHTGAVTLPPSQLTGCGLEGTITFGSAGTFFFDSCHSGIAGTSTPVIDFGSGLNASDVNFRAYSGGIEIQNMGTGTGSYNMSLEGFGQLVINANCSATSAVAIRGNFTIADSAGGAVTLSDDARIDVDQVGDAVADEVITGATHNVSNSLGRRIRELDEQIGYESGAIWIDTANGVAGTTVGENGTVNNPVDSIADALTLAVAIGIVRMRVASGSSITLAAALEGYEIYNANWTLALGGQSVSGSCIRGASVSGICTGATEPDFIDCQFGNATLPPSRLVRCSFSGTITAGSAGSWFLDNCFSAVAGTSSPVFDFGTGLNASNVNYRHYSGGVEIQNMGAGTGSYNMSLEGFGQLVINANCSATSTIAIRGNFTITDNAGGAVTLSDDARIDVDQVGDAIWDEATSGHTTSGTFGEQCKTDIDAILADTGTDGVAIATAVQQSIADELLKRGIDNVEDTANALSVTALVLAALESSISGTTWTIKKSDGTTFTTKTVTTDADADPITAVT